MNKRDEIIKGVDFLNYLRSKYHLKKIGNDSYTIEPCPVCNGKDHFRITSGDGHYFFKSFAECIGEVNGGSIIEFMQYVDGMDKETAYNECLKLLGDKTHQETYKTPINANNDVLDVTENIKQYLKSIKDNDKSKATEYLIKTRGIDEAVVKSIQYFYDHENDYLCMPLSDTLLIQRRLVDTGEKDKVNYPGSKVKPIGYENLKNKDTVFIVEAVIDGLSLGTDLKGDLNGFISLNSTTHAKTLVNDLRTIKNDITGIKFILALDNDKSGIEATKIIKKFLKENSIPCIEFNHNQKYKDLNEYLVNDRDNFKAEVKRLLDYDISKPDLVKNYFDVFAEDIKKFKEREAISTGFFKLDKHLDGGLYPGLYVLGAISSLGKTTFIQQIADNIAKKGKDVLFFSLEMSKFEMISKSISRLTFENVKTRTEAVTTRQIQKGYGNNAVIESLKNYREIAEKLSIIEGDFDTTIDDIKRKVSSYKQLNGTAPVLIVDYLQILQSDKKDHGTDKVKIDYLTTELKVLSRKFDIPVIVISSLNRSNYDTVIAFESFKESGNIEYSADVILGLQLKVTSTLDQGAKEDTKNKKREKINEAKEKTPREIELICLKNRNGISYFKQEYEFYSKFNYFMEQ